MEVLQYKSRLYIGMADYQSMNIKYLFKVYYLSSKIFIRFVEVMDLIIVVFNPTMDTDTGRI